MTGVQTKTVRWQREKQPLPEWDKKKTRKYYRWNIYWLALACLLLTIGTLALSVADFEPLIFRGYFECPSIFIMNFLLPMALCLLLFLLTGRAWLAYLLTALLCLGIAIGNFYLILIRCDPLRFTDILYLREALDITAEQNYTLRIDWRVISAVLVCGGATVALAFLARWTPPVKKRLGLLIGTACTFAVTVPLLMLPVIHDHVCQYFRYVNYWSAPEIAMSRGVLYSFTYGAVYSATGKPAGYNAQEAQALLAQYTDADIPQEQKVNVLVIMRESYNDLSDLGFTGVDWSAYDAYHSLEAESYSGRLITNGFGGNTKDAERGFLTGSYNIGDYRKPTNSYVWYLRQQGYQTEGAHPFNGWFYNRQNVNRYLGFEDYRFREDTFDALVGTDTVADDAVLYEVLLQMYLNSDENTPYFSFSTTFEGHGPYYVNSAAQFGSADYILQNQGTQAANSLNNYLNCVQHRDRELMELVEALRTCERPTVLLLYGDHNATLGEESYSTDGYTQFGVNMELSTEEGYYNYYSTEYLIWANDAAKQVLNFDFTGEGPTVSPCYLMNVLADALGWDGSAYLQLMRDYMQAYPIVTLDGTVSVDGTLTKELQPQAASELRGLQEVSYYWQNNFRYQNVQTQS